jgi:hypothetical protein
MKRTPLSFLIIPLLLLFVGCGQADSGTPKYTQEDTYLVIDGAQYRCGGNIDAVIAALGDGYAYAEGRSCDYDGMDKTFIYPVAEFYTWPLEGGDIVNEIYTQDPAVTTSRGIAVGAGAPDVLAAYGSDCEDTGWQLIYTQADSPALCFDLEDGIVRAISLTMQPS